MNYFLIITLGLCVFLGGCQDHQQLSEKDEGFEDYINENLNQEEPPINALINVKF